jgi:hypothetical protein
MLIEYYRFSGHPSTHQSSAIYVCRFSTKCLLLKQHLQGMHGYKSLVARLQYWIVFQIRTSNPIFYFERQSELTAAKLDSFMSIHNLCIPQSQPLKHKNSSKLYLKLKFLPRRKHTFFTNVVHRNNWCSFWTPYKIQWKPLIMITLGPALFDNNNRLITLSRWYKNLHYLTQFIVTTFYMNFYSVCSALQPPCPFAVEFSMSSLL